MPARELFGDVREGFSAHGLYRVVDQDVEASELRGCLLNEHLRLRPVTHVGLDSDRPTPRLLNTFYYCLCFVHGRNIIHHDGRPIGRQPLRGCRTDAARRSGNDRNFAFQIRHPNTLLLH